MLPLPRNAKDDVLFCRDRDTHPLYPNLLLCLGHSNLESLVFLLPYCLQRLAQDSSTDLQIRRVLAVEGVVGLELVDLCLPSVRGSCESRGFSKQRRGGKKARPQGGNPTTFFKSKRAVRWNSM
jgi:hypothetical protein